MNRATTQPVQTDGDTDTDPIAELQQLISNIDGADPGDAAALASQAIGILQSLGGSVADDDEDQGDDDAEGDDELEAKAAALRLRMKMLR